LRGLLDFFAKYRKEKIVFLFKTLFRQNYLWYTKKDIKLAFYCIDLFLTFVFFDIKGGLNPWQEN